MKNEWVKIRIEPELKRQAQAVASARGSDLSAMIRAALARAIRREQKKAGGCGMSGLLTCAQTGERRDEG